MLKRFGFLAALFLSVIASGALAADDQPQGAEEILARLSAARPDLTFSSVEPSPIEGLYQVRVNGTQLLYVSRDGNHIVAGDMFQILPGRLVPVSDLELAKTRKELLTGVPAAKTIAYPSLREDGKTLAVLHVFTDVDCSYCRKLHNEAVPTLRQNGVEVRYLAFPRAGVGSPSYRKIASAWCADDAQSALNDLKNGQRVEDNVCEGNPVAAQYDMGQKMGVTGTPALIMADGTLMPGYRPAGELLKIFGL